MTAAKKQLVDIKLLKTLVPLSELDDQRLLRLQETVVIEHIEAGTQLFAKGERDGLTYYLLSGQVQLTFVSGLERTVNADTGAACRALAPEQPRTATAIAATPITLLSIETVLLHELQSWGHHGYEVSDIEGEGDSDWMTLFLQSKVFLKLPAQNIQALMMRMEEITVRTGKVIIRQGDDDGYYYIIKRGHARVTRRFSPQDDEVELAMLGPGAGFGEEAIITHNRRGATVTMVNSGSLMRLSRNEFNNLLVEPLIQEVDYQEVLENKNHMFLDVRSYDDYIEDGIAGSQNISIAELRPKIAMLESGKQYVVCSNTGSRAAAATFLLCQQGMDAVVLKNGLQGLPAEVKRGNQSAPRGDEIPLVDNVVSFKKTTGVEPAPAGLVDPEQAMKDPRVQSLFSRAKRRVQHESQRAQQAEDARLKAESEVQRLKAEAEQARLEAEEAQRQVEQAAHQSAEAARLEAKKEAARLRELELGAKQAEMEEAVHQAEQEAQRAHDAEVARKQAEEEIDRLKAEMQTTLQQAQEEAKKSAEAMRQFVEEQAKKEKEDAERRAAEEAQRARQAEEELARLKAEAEVTKQKLEQEAKIAADQARSAVEQEAARMRAEVLAVEQQEKELAINRAEENARRAQAAEQARLQAEAEIERLRKEAELVRIEANQQAREMVEAARTQAEQEAARTRAEEMSRTQFEAEQVLRRAEEQAARAKAAEQARLEAEAEIERLRHEAESARQTADAVRIAAEQETARVRAEEMAKKQYEMEQAAQKAAQEARRQAEQEIALIKLQAEQERQHLKEQASRVAESVRLETEREALQKADAEARRAQEAEQARQVAEEEIARLKAEAESARLQIKEQLTAEVARSEIEHEVARVRAEELAKKQWEIEEMARKAEEESSRAQAAEEARKHAEAEIQRLKGEADATRIQIGHAQGSDNPAHDALLTQTLSQKQNEIDAVARHARDEADRALAAEQARRQAQQEIDRLREEVAVATLQAQAQLARDAERAAAEEEAVRQRAAELSYKETQIQAAIERAELQSQRASEAEQARQEAEAEIRRLRVTEVAHHEAQQEIERLKAGMAYYQAQEQAKANVAAAEKRARQEVQLAARRAEEEKRRAESAEQARHKAEQEISRLKQEAESERLKSEQTIRASIKTAKRQLDEKLIRMRASEKARRSVEQKRGNATQHQQHEETLRPRPSTRPTPTQRRNTVDSNPLVDFMPNFMPEQTVIDLDAAAPDTDNNDWVSDQVMWETTIGVREDRVAENLISPEHERVKSATPVSPTTQAVSRGLERAQFTVRDTNPYVNTQRVNGVFKRTPRGRIRKTLLGVLACAVLTGGGYYWSLDHADKTGLQLQVHNLLSNDNVIMDITSSVKAQISHLSQSTKARINNTNAANSAAEVTQRDHAQAGSTPLPVKVLKKHTATPARQSEQEPLSFEERVKLKVERKEKVLQQRMEHRRELERARDTKRSQPSQILDDQQSELQPVLVAPTTANDSASAIVEPVQSDKQVKITVLSTPAVQPEVGTQEATTQEEETTSDAVKPVQLVD